MKLYVDGECVAEFDRAELVDAVELPAIKGIVGGASLRSESITITGTVHVPGDPEALKWWRETQRAWRVLRADPAWEFDDIRKMRMMIHDRGALPPCDWPRDFWGTP